MQNKHCPILSIALRLFKMKKEKGSTKINSELGADERIVPRKRGPAPGAPTRKYNLLLDEELAEWGKRQAGGLSGLVRRLLKEERERGASDS
jgi:hypothetical protein